HGLVTGARVYVTGVAGNTNANGIFTVTRIDSNRFSLDNTTSNGTYAGGGTWSSGVFQNLFQTTPTQSNVETVSKTANLLAFAGLPIRIRFAATNNRGKLIMSVDSVSLKATFSDSAAPTLGNLALRNPGFIDATDGLSHTTDPTLMGRVGDNGTPNNIAYIGIDTNNDGFSPNDPNDIKVTTWDPVGNFSYTLPNLSFGAHTINLVAVDKAGNVSATGMLSFFYQGPSLTDWQEFGPSAIDTTGQGVDYKNVTGRVTAVLVDPSDPNGNTLLIGAPNGGIWRTTDGGKDWTPETDYLTDKSGNPIAAPVSALAVSASNPAIMYAGTGVADNSFDSRPGVGVLKSTDGGKTWGLVGNSDTVLGGARVTKVVVDNDDPNTVYVAVASGGASGPGVYKSTDGGQTWVNVLDPAKMFLAGSTSTLGAGTALASVTDLLIDPFDNNRLLVALGNMGLVPANGTAGLWVSTNKGDTWLQELGGFNGGGSLPNGSNVGRVTLAIGSGRPGDEKYLYVLVGTPPGNNTPPNHDQGSMAGLYRSNDGLLTFTKVMLRQNVPTGNPGVDNNGRPLPDVNYQDINVLGQDASYAGALLVDPTDPNVVYVGGSRRFDSAIPGAASDVDHVLIRVDTGNMDPATGDDKTKEAVAAAKGGYYDTAPPYSPGSTIKYNGEGVSWYDLEQGVFSGTSNKRYLPPAIHALAFDPLGRLIVATEGGVFRGQGYGFGYDFTSGGGNGGGGNSSIVGGQPPKVPGMTFISLNSNLQIAELNSVAIDHTQPGVYYTANVGTGTSTSTGLLQWVSSGLTGPVVNGINLNIPTAAFIKIAGTDPTQPAGTPSNIYRGWLFEAPGALLPEVSSDGGLSFNPVGTTGIPNNLVGGLFPAFAVSANKVLNSGLYEDVLLFGADRVYTSNTSGNLWLKPTPDVALSTGSITAMAIAPSNTNVQYVGLDNGQVFVKDANATSFTLRVTGLPSGASARRVNGITVDPNNPQVAYVLLDGTGTGHVWRTTNGGLSWSDISGNLPNVPAHALVTLPDPILGAPQGRLIVATDVGVFFSTTGGATWGRFGQGIPNVPVVDLEYDASQQVIVAASQGRGLFVLSTDRSQVISSTPGIFDAKTGLWLLRNDVSAGNPDVGLFYGWPGALPVTGDWNGDKVDTIGIYYNGLWLLRNSNSPGGADIGLYFGWAGAIPVVGDWNGDGVDTVGLFDPNTATWYLQNSNATGAPVTAFSFGWKGVIPVVGDWTGSGHDGIGIYDPRLNLWLLRNSATAGGPDIGFYYGFAGAQPVVGDWNGDGIDTPGIYYNGLWLLRNSNSGGGPDIGFYYGWAGSTGVAGDWNGPGNPLRLAGEAVAPDAATPLLTGDALQAAITMAIASWSGAGLDAAHVAALRNLHFAIADLPGTTLGLEQSSAAIFLDRDAAGHGWALTPAGGAPDPQRVDLVSVVAHEMGHALGLPDVDATLYPASVMGDLLPLGVRRLPTAADVDALFSMQANQPYGW
ncbi:MAG TPA: hypothetical protein VFA26_19700, partial [Gemmataceae bacterium]|nr:hypothetical protein [Gemmataceae bacterium]